MTHPDVDLRKTVIETTQKIVDAFPSDRRDTINLVVLAEGMQIAYDIHAKKRGLPLLGRPSEFLEPAARILGIAPGCAT